MKLYYFPGACSLASHIVASEAGLPLKIEKVDLKSKRTEGGGDFAAINPKGSVPALEMDEGGVLTENAVIMQYLAEKAPQAGLAPREGMARWRLLEMVNFIATDLHKGFAPLFNPATSADMKEMVIENLKKKFDMLERQLGGQQYLTGSAFTIADAYAFTVLNWSNFVKLDMSKWSKLTAFMGRVAARPAVQKALKAEGLA